MTTSSAAASLAAAWLSGAESLPGASLSSDVPAPHAARRSASVAMMIQPILRFRVTL
jgi:hypothetical protein